MKRIPIKAVSLALAASMMLSIAACNKKGGSGGSGGSGSNATSRSGDKITADSPWFDSQVIDVDLGLDESKPIESVYARLVGADSKKLITYTGGYYKMPPDSKINWETFDYTEYAIDTISIIDRESGMTTGTIDLRKIMTSNDYLDATEYENGIIKIKISSYDENTMEQSIKELSIDPDTGNVMDTKVVADANNSIERSFKLGDYQIDTEMVWEDACVWYKLYVTSPDGNTHQIDVKDNEQDYYDIPIVLSKDENTAVVPVSCDSGYAFFEIDLKTNKLTPADSKEYEWLDLEQCYSPFTGKDGFVYFTSPSGICKIDFNKKIVEKVFDYSWCNVNRSILSNLEIADYDGDSFVLCGNSYNNPGYGTDDGSDFCLVEFNKAKTNPHAGKTILELYSPYSYTQDKIADAILKFNDTNENYFIEVSDRYSSLDDSNYSEVNTDDDIESINLNTDSKLSNQLAMDILNGEGPDILMNVSSYGQINNGNYLTDLTPYIGDLDPQKFFTNVVDASKVDGKLYNLPICFEIEGIHTDAKYAGASGVGFTTEEYEKFLKETLNGKDVITSGQAYYFAKLFTNMSDKFIVNGKADFSSPEFAILAEYVRDNVREKALSWDEMDDEYSTISYGVGFMTVKGDRGFYEMGPACYTTSYGMSTYLMETAQLQGGTAILGLPSADGRGPMVLPYISVAVSAQAQNADACGEFVKLLLSDELQLDFAMKDNFVISRAAYKEGAKACVEYYNGEGYANYFGEDAAESKNRYIFSDKNIDDMEKIIESCSGMSSRDAAINLILIEEMPAYFTGQKDIKDVVAIAQDRVQKVLDERG